MSVLDAIADRLDAPEFDPFEALGFVPNPGPQTEFLALPDANDDVLYGGAAGGSKSTSLLMYALRSCVRYPGLQAFWFRKTFPQLRHSILRLLARYQHARALGARFDASSWELRFDNGSILTFGHAKNREEAEALQSAEINLLLLDERTTMPPGVVDHLYTRVRSGTPGVPCLGIRSATNPGGVGHGSVLAGFLKPTNFGEHTYTNTAGRTVRFLQARASDTPQLGAEYERTLEGIEDPALRKAMRDGSWDVFPNQMFGEFDRAKHVVPQMELPASWLRYGGFDWGWTASSVYELAARDEDGRLWVYRELTRTKTPEPQLAREVLALENGDQVAMRSADPAMWGKNGQAQPQATQFAMEGCALRKADNDRIGGWGRLHTFLADSPACTYHRGLGQMSCSMIHFVDGACPKIIETLPMLPRDDNRPEDVDTDAEDHWGDALRYLCMSVGSTAQVFSADDSVDEAPFAHDPMHAPDQPIVPEEQLHEQHGPIGSPRGAFSIDGEASELDSAYVGGIRNPFL